MLPFLYGLAITNGSINTHASKLLKERPQNKWPILSLLFIRILIAVSFILMAITSYFNLGAWGVLIAILAGLLIIFIAKVSVRNLSGLEKRFLENLNARDELERKKSPVATSVRDKMSKYDIRTTAVEVSPDFAYIGKSLREMPFRKSAGVNIIKIQRGSQNIEIPSGNEPIYPYDRLIAVGTPAQLEAFTDSLKENTHIVPDEAGDSDFVVLKIDLNQESYLTGKSLREADMRKGGCMVISIQHGNSIITNPGADFRFTEGDTVWIAGNAKSCEWYK